MLTYFKKMLAFSVLSSSFIFQAHALTIKPHVGADYKFWEIKEKQLDATRDYFSIFPYMSRAGTLYVGTRINKIWGIDFGYDRSAKKDEWHTYESTTTLTPVFGDPPVVGDSIQTDFRIEAWHLSGLFYWEIFKNFELVFHLGIASLQPKSTIIYYHAALPNNPIELRFQLKSKWAGRFGFGAQYLFFKHFGARALVTFDQTSRINYVGINQNLNPFDIHPYRNSTSYNVGLFAEFDLCPTRTVVVEY